MEKEEITAEIRRVQEILQALMPQLRSRWQGAVELASFPDTLGLKEFTCEISLDAACLQSGLRWIVYLHELLHSFSAGYGNAVYYEQFRGWEEGVVEALERRLRPYVINALGISFDQASLSDIALYDRCNEYNRYVTALENICEALGIAADARQAFYIEQLSINLNDRSKMVVKTAAELCRQSHPVLRKQMLSVRIEADNALREE